MSLQTLVKVGAITNLSDARYCAGMGVDMLGFSLDSAAPHYVDPATFQAITEWVAGVPVIGEVETIEVEAVTQLRSQYAIDGLQLAHTTDWATLKSLRLTLICTVSWTDNFTLAHFQARYQAVAPYVDYFLIEADTDSLTPESGYHLAQIAEQYPVLLGFGITQDTILQTLSAVPVKGIALKGGQEIRPGYKDFDDLSEILETLETD
jgi:phosphoribosylanthranilate isomerase